MLAGILALVWTYGFRRVSRRGWAVLAGVAVVLALALGAAWFSAPAVDRDAFANAVANWQRGRKHITAGELAGDFWSWHLRRDWAATNWRPGKDTHAFGGSPRVAATDGPPCGAEARVLVNAAYTLGYCEGLKSPLWGGYRVWDLPEIPRSPPRPPGFQPDPRTAARVESADYNGSGYDRGHMVPNFAIATRWGQAAQRETFLLSNISPQRHRLNAGPWARLEQRIDDNYAGRFGTVWVLVGPVFASRGRSDVARLPAGVAVPEAFYMVLVVQNARGGVRVQAVIMPQEERGGRDELAGHVTTVEEVERRTGLEFFPELEPTARATLRRMKPWGAW